MTRILAAMLLSAFLCSGCAAGFAEGPGAPTVWGLTSSDNSAQQALQAQWAQQDQQQAMADAMNAQQQLNQQVQQQINMMNQSMMQPPTPTFP